MCGGIIPEVLGALFVCCVCVCVCVCVCALRHPSTLPAGTLLDHVRGSDPDVLNTSLLLSYCHDVAAGLHYLSSRKVVHRDIAARNVSTAIIICCPRV